MSKNIQLDELTRLLRQGADAAPRPTEECLEDDDVAALMDGALGADEERRLRPHVAACDYCLERVGLLGRLRDARDPTPAGDELQPESDLLARVRRLPEERRRPARPRWSWVAAAATAVLAVGLVVTQQRGLEAPGESVTSVRDGNELLQSPTILWPQEGSSIPLSDLRRRELDWSPVPGAIFYEVRLVNADGERLWDARVDADRARVPEHLQGPVNQDLFLWVRAYLPSGKTLQSGIVGFRLRGSSEE